MPTYYLLDTAQCLYFHQKLEKSGIPYESLFEGHPEAHLLEIAPLLFELNTREATHQRIRREIESIGARAPAVSVIESPSDLRTLARHFRQFHLVGIPEQQQLLLRWYDTRILPPWFAILTPSQKSGFLHTISHWQYQDRYGQPHDLEWEPHPQLVLPPFQLDTEQYQKLLRSSQADGVLAQLRRIIPDEMRLVPYPILFPFIDQHMTVAREYGIDTIDDQVQYALLALHTSGRFIEHPAIKDLPHSSFGPERPFTDWAMALPEDIWSHGSPLWSSGNQGISESIGISDA